MKEATIELSHKVDYIVCSKDFAEDYTKRKVNYEDLTSLIVIYNFLKKDFESRIVITLEDKGCFVYDDGYKLVPTLKMKAIDTTGAGDIFHGAFTYALSSGYDYYQSLEFANITASLSTTKSGGRKSIPDLEEVINVKAKGKVKRKNS